MIVTLNTFYRTLKNPHCLSLISVFSGTCTLISMLVQYGQPLKIPKTVEISAPPEYLSVVHMTLLSNVTQSLEAPFQHWATFFHSVKTTTKMFIFLQALVFTVLLVQAVAVTLVHWKRQRPLLLLPLLHLIQAVVVTSSPDICFCIFHPFCCFT